MPKLRELTQPSPQLYYRSNDDACHDDNETGEKVLLSWLSVATNNRSVQKSIVQRVMRLDVIHSTPPHITYFRNCPHRSKYGWFLSTRDYSKHAKQCSEQDRVQSEAIGEVRPPEVHG